MERTLVAMANLGMTEIVDRVLNTAVMKQVNNERYFIVHEDVA